MLSLHCLNFLTPPPLPLIRGTAHPFPPRRRRCVTASSSSVTRSSPAFPSSAIRRIAEKLRSLGFLEEDVPRSPTSGPGTAGEIFIPVPHHLPKHRVGQTLDPSWSTPEAPVPEPGSSQVLTRLHEVSRAAERERMRGTGGEERTHMAAEVMLSADELRRLRKNGIELRKRMKIGKAGITEGIVNAIHERWRRAELVKIKCEDLCRMNMKRTHEMLERKTGGLVIWRSGSVIILYRGMDYKYPYFTDFENLGSNRILSSVPISTRLAFGQGESPDSVSQTNNAELSKPSLVMGVGSKKLRIQLPGEAQLEAEADKLLDGLGQRFTDWWGYDPQPVDADLLPAVHGFRKPFRLLPFGVQPKLTDREMTILRRLARPLPCHFALGRNRNLQGLAASMIKLWERCEIAKIAVKRGVQNMNSELMAEELKKLTGGTLLSRDKDFIVFYRGKDFLPVTVSHAIEERRNNILYKRSCPNESLSMSTKCLDSESREPDRSEKLQETHAPKISSEEKKASPKLTLKSIEVRLSKAMAKKEKAEQTLGELERSKELPKPEADKESISEEERYMLRRIGLRMKPFLLLGRRGAFDGTIENMHLHWKYRELVKVILKRGSIEDVYATARTIEAASGGILVAVERVNMGYAIIVYRGKNYRRPVNLRPHTLLSKKAAYRRYLENQRQESLQHHVLRLHHNIEKMKHMLVQYDKEEETSRSNDCDSSSIICENIDNSMPLKCAEKASIDQGNECGVTGGLESIRCGNTLDVKTTVDGLSTPEKDLSSILTIKTGFYAEGLHTNSLDGNQNMTELALGSSSRASTLSNKERLMLRKQALHMKQRPVLAVAKNSVVTGVAKAIKVHFRKYPLAIVNIKGVVDKGTSIQEVIFELERTTGSMMVSREPSKVILYRGWRGEGKKDLARRKNENVRISSTADESISSELLNAIQMESGLPAENK